MEGEDIQIRTKRWRKTKKSDGLQDDKKGQGTGQMGVMGR